MKLELDAYDSLCELSLFLINNIEAAYEDFGSKDDKNPEVAEDYGCGDMTFEPKPAEQRVLDKYRITVSEYNEVCEQLQGKLSFGCCGWCV